jgi:hypothetical protein
MSEQELRDWVRKAFRGEVEWIAHGRGGTVGLADCLIVIDAKGAQLPLELKVWELKTRGLCCKIRPVQRRYHIMASRNGTRTAFLVAIPSTADPDTFGLYMFSGKRTPLRDYPSPVVSLVKIGTSADDIAAVKRKLLATVHNRSFWE